MCLTVNEVDVHIRHFMGGEPEWHSHVFQASLPHEFDIFRILEAYDVGGVEYVLFSLNSCECSHKTVYRKQFDSPKPVIELGTSSAKFLANMRFNFLHFVHVFVDANFWDRLALFEEGLQCPNIGEISLLSYTFNEDSKSAELIFRFEKLSKTFYGKVNKSMNSKNKVYSWSASVSVWEMFVDCEMVVIH